MTPDRLAYIAIVAAVLGVLLFMSATCVIAKEVASRTPALARRRREAGIVMEWR